MCNVVATEPHIPVCCTWKKPSRGKGKFCNSPRANTTLVGKGAPAAQQRLHQARGSPQPKCKGKASYTLNRRTYTTQNTVCQKQRAHALPLHKGVFKIEQIVHKRLQLHMAGIAMQCLFIYFPLFSGVYSWLSIHRIGIVSKIHLSLFHLSCFVDENQSYLASL